MEQERNGTNRARAGFLNYSITFIILSMLIITLFYSFIVLAIASPVCIGYSMSHYSSSQ